MTQAEAVSRRGPKSFREKDAARLRMHLLAAPPPSLTAPLGSACQRCNGSLTRGCCSTLIYSRRRERAARRGRGRTPANLGADLSSMSLSTSVAREASRKHRPLRIRRTENDVFSRTRVRVQFTREKGECVCVFLRRNAFSTRERKNARVKTYLSGNDSFVLPHRQILDASDEDRRK